MIIRETVLMPSLQYILKQMETGFTADTLENLRRFSDYQSKPVCQEVNDIVELLEQYLTDEKSAKENLEQRIEKPNKCNLCVTCYHCMQYFLIEIYQILFDDDRFDGVKESLRGSNHYVMRRLPDRIYGELDSKISASEYYWERCKQLRKVKTFENRLIILKGMSSSTPAVLNGAFNTHSFHGGGIYINWCGFGIAIDPGYHFVDNMHQIGLTVLNVDAVVITHEHIDHTNDIRILDDLNYNLSKYGKKGETHRIHWYLDKVTYGLAKALQAEGSGFLKKTNTIFEILPERQKISHEECCEDEKDVTQNIQKDYGRDGIIIKSDKNHKIVLKTVRTFHERRQDGTEKTNKKYLNHTFAATFELSKDTEHRKVFYTSDTMYDTDVGEAARGADIVIANISSVYENDLLRIKLKETHLGYMGCYKLLKAMKECPPKYFLISEFWNAKTDIRFDVSRFLKEEICERNEERFKMTRIIPTDIGMQLDLEHMSVLCGVCGEKTRDFIVVRPQEEYHKIRCVCRKCFY